MKQEDVWKLEDQVEQFKERLAGMAHYHQQTCALLLAHRMKLDMEKLTQPTKQHHPFLTRLGAWVLSQIAAYRTPPVDEDEVLSSDEHVTVINTTYRVIEPDDANGGNVVHIREE
jgi:hypothetical protein